MQNAAIERVLSIPNVPTLPAVALRVLELVSKRDASVREIASVIENDPALASKVLRTVNSSFFGLTRRCGSIQQALVYLGLHSLKALVLGFTLTKGAGPLGDDDIGFDFPTYWRQSIYSAAAAREIALRHRRCDPDEAFLTALICDIGMVALWRAYGDRYLQVVDISKGDHDRLCAIERRTLVTDHAEIAAEMTVRWRFPIAFAQAIRFHHRVSELSGDVLPLARTIALAAVATNVLAKKGSPENLDRFRNDARDWFAIRESTADDLLADIVRLATELSESFELDTGETPDVEAILAEAERLRQEQALVEPGVVEDGREMPQEAPIELESIPDSHVFSEDLARAFQGSRLSEGSSIGLLLIGLDRARAIQQNFGTQGVEAALRHTIQKLRMTLPRGAKVYRFVGAELAVMLPSVEIDEMCRIAEFIRRGASESEVECPTASGGGFPITISIGISNYERAPEIAANTGIATPDQLVSGAMFALASGRRARDRVVVYRRELKSGYGAA